ncbi:MAG: response regulator [Bryobacterales bacterium]|nr:response regulator [Bryobacterales bacterium]
MVDDNCHGLSARKCILEEFGYEVVVCTDPVRALAEFSKAAFDLIITDYKMPGMDGLQLIRKVRETNAAIPVILISGFVEALGLTEENTGSNAVVQKSANEVQHLVRAVTRLLRKKAPRKPVSSVRTAPPLKAKSKGVS